MRMQIRRESIAKRTKALARPASRFSIVAGCIIASCLLVGCGNKGGRTPQNPERQAEAEYDLAREAFFKGQPRQALDHSLKAVELDSDNAKALYFTAVVYAFFCDSVQGLQSPDCKLAEAEKYARLAVGADERFRDAKNLLGQILIHENKHAEAIATLEPLTRDPAYTDSHKAWANLGWAQLQKGDVDAAIASLRNAVTEPRFCVGHYRLGVAQEKKGNLAQAETALTTAVTVDDAACQNLQDAWEARGRVRKRMGKTAEAKADYEKCKEISIESRTGKSCLQALVAFSK